MSASAMVTLVYGVFFTMSEQHTTQNGQSASPNLPALPATVEELLAQRQSLRIMTLNDYVDGIHIALWPNAEYRRLLEAVYDEDAVEGSLTADNHIAAGMIRAYAKDPATAVPEVANKKLATIIKALNVVLRRFNMSRKQRANMIGGIVVSHTGE